MKIAVRWLRIALFAGAISMLAYCAFVVVDTWTFQKQQRRQFESVLADRALVTPPPVAANGVIGLLDIPRLGISVMVVEGVGSKASGARPVIFPGQRCRANRGTPESPRTVIPFSGLCETSAGTT